MKVHILFYPKEILYKQIYNDHILQTHNIEKDTEKKSWFLIPVSSFSVSFLGSLTSVALKIKDVYEDEQRINKKLTKSG